MKKKVIWLAHEGNMSGANIAMLEYAEGLSDEYDFHFIIPHGGTMEEAFTKNKFPFSIIKQYNWAVAKQSQVVNKVKRRLRTMAAIQETKKLIRTFNADLVFTNTQVPFTAARAAGILHKPHIWWIHEFGEEDFGFKIGYGKPQNAYKLLAKSQLLIVNSEAVKKKFSELLPDTVVERIYQPVVIPPAENSEKTNKYLMFGQIIPSKGHVDVLQSLLTANNKNTLLDIVGPCENNDYLEALKLFIRDNGLKDQVIIKTGIYKKQEVIPAYHAIIVASDAEAFGRVIIEAHKYGLPAIVKNKGGAPELLNDSNGLLYDTKDELAVIFAGIKKLPTGPITLNYDEAEEVLRLKILLKQI